MKNEMLSRMNQVMNHVGNLPCPREFDEKWVQNCPNCFSQGNMRDCLLAWIEHGSVEAFIASVQKNA